MSSSVTDDKLSHQRQAQPPATGEASPEGDGSPEGDKEKKLSKAQGCHPASFGRGWHPIARDAHPKGIAALKAKLTFFSEGK